MNMELKVIPPQLIPQMWDQMRPYFQSAYEEAGVTEYGTAETLTFLTQGHWAAVGFFDKSGKMHGALGLTMHAYPNERVAFVTAIGGRKITNKENWEQLKAICRHYGASKLQAYSRESVARLWQRLGFTNRTILVEATL